jgi:hypothetical protein
MQQLALDAFLVAEGFLAGNNLVADLGLLDYQSLLKKDPAQQTALQQTFVNDVVASSFLLGLGGSSGGNQVG